MTDARSRYLQTMAFQPADPPFVVAGWAWAETREQWLTQGWDGTAPQTIFGTDGYYDVSPDYGPAPPFTYEVVEEDELTCVFIDQDGIMLREFKTHRDTSMPQFLRFPVETEEDFAKLQAERLGPRVDQRITADWLRHAAGAEASGLPRRCWPGRWGGFFGAIRNFMGLENLCLAFYDQPALVERMMAERAETLIAVTEAVLDHTPLDCFWFWEDMAYNHASLVDPRVFRRLALPHYKRVVEALRARGVRTFGLDSDGEISELIPIWLDAGINFLWPFEVAAGMDVVQVRKQYGHNLALGGGIPKQAVAIGGEEMRRAVDRVMPLVEDGGYIPELDHGAPPDITWDRFCEYMDYLMKRLGRG